MTDTSFSPLSILSSLKRRVISTFHTGLLVVFYSSCKLQSPALCNLVSSQHLNQDHSRSLEVNTRENPCVVFIPRERQAQQHQQFRDQHCLYHDFLLVAKCALYQISRHFSIKLCYIPASFSIPIITLFVFSFCLI